jgi:subtilisin family serine protease
LKITIGRVNIGGGYIDLVAPGLNVLTTYWGTQDYFGPLFGPFQGTSAAAPFVSGVAALLKAKQPELTNRQIKYILEGSAIDQIGNTFDDGTLEDQPGFDTYYGWGLVNVYGALTAQLSFDRGDVNNDGMISISDVIYLINYLFKFGPRPNPEKADTNCDGKVSLSDIVFLINYLFKGGPQPCSI